MEAAEAVEDEGAHLVHQALLEEALGQTLAVFFSL